MVQETRSGERKQNKTRQLSTQTSTSSKNIFKIESGKDFQLTKTKRIVFQQTYSTEMPIKFFRWKADNTICKPRSTGKKKAKVIKND